jgi:hypothetical protein
MPLLLPLLPLQQQAPPGAWGLRQTLLPVLLRPPLPHQQPLHSPPPQWLLALALALVPPVRLLQAPPLESAHPRPGRTSQPRCPWVLLGAPVALARQQRPALPRFPYLPSAPRHRASSATFPG